VPRLLNYVARFKSNEMLLVTVLGILFGFCLLVMKLQYSVALGAFLVGAIMAESRQLHRIERLIEPVRDMFSAIFFVAIGLLFDPKVLAQYWLPILVITLAVVFGKLFSCGIGTFLSGHGGRTPMRVGMGLAQIGEFSFIIAALGVSLKVTSDFLYPIVVAVSAVTALLTPYLIRAADPLSARAVELVPGKIAGILGLYMRWLESLQPTGDKAELSKIIRRILLQVMVNLALVVAIFLAGAFFVDGISSWLGRWIADPAVRKAVIWGAALVLSLPFLIATYRKLQALAMLLAEVGVRPELAGAYTAGVRRIISEVIPVMSIVAIMVLIFVLSASILPPLNLLAVVLLGAGGLLWLLWSKLVKLHSRLQIALFETLDEKPDDAH
jgi:CPA2 family monovalent cation:H+ antiporter-2